MAYSDQVPVKDKISRVYNIIGRVSGLGRMKQDAYGGSYGDYDGYYK